MADVKKTIEVIFAGTDKMSGTVADVSGKIGDFAGSVESATQPLADLSTAILKVDAVLGAMAIGGMAVAINQAGKFGDSFNEISTLTDASADSLDKFKSDIVAYARDSTASIDDINKSIYSAISAGTSYTDSLAILNTAEKLSVAGKADLEATTRILVSSLNAYGASTDEAASYSDALFKTVKLGQTTLPELAASLAQVSTTAANSGVSFDELLASVAAITATGAPTTQAITAIRAAINAIIKPSAEAAKEAERLGIQFDAGALASKGLDGVLKDVYTSTGGATEEIVKLFGSVESLPAVMTLGKDASGNFAKTLDEFKNKAGATAEAYAKMAENFGLVNQNLANNVNATFIQVGDRLLATYTDIVSGVTDIFKSLGSSIDAGSFDEIFAALDVVGGEMSDFLQELANSLPAAFEKVDWSEFIKSFEGLSDSISGIFSDFDPSDPQDVADAIQFVVDSLGSLADVTSGMVQVMDPVINKIIEMAQAFNDLDSDTKVLIGNIIEIGAVTSVIAGITAAAALAVKGIALLVGSFKPLSALASGGGVLLPIIISIVGGQVLADLIYSWIPGLEEADKKAFTITVNMAGSLYDFLIGDAISQLETWGTDLGGAAGKALRNAFGDGLGNLEDDLNSIDWSGWEDIAPTVELTVDTTSIETAFDEIQSNWDVITSEIENSDIQMPTPETNFDSIQSDWDAINNEIEKSDIKIPVDADDKSIEDTKKKIQQTFSQMSGGDIKLGFNFDGGGGVGPADSIADYFKNEIQNSDKIPLDDLFDPGGMADLFDSMKGLTDPRDIENARRAIEQQLKLQKETVDAQNSLTKAQAAIAEQMWKAANIMHSSIKVDDSTIKIDASGVEPEIEAFMYKILKKIQIRANESGAEFLLAAAA